MKTAQGLVEWAEAAYKAKWVYWYGTCGYDCTTSLLERKTKQYPAHYTDKRQPTYKKHIEQGRVCADCIGLFKSYAWDEDGDINTRESIYRSNGQPDQGAKTTLNKTKVKGDISTIPEIPGLAVWTKTGGHIGIYVGDGYVVEARGYSYGVQRNKLSDRAFRTWGLYPYVEYTPEQVALAEAAMGSKPTETEGKTVKVELSVLRIGSKGEQVKTVQRLLNAMGYDCGEADGDFGAKTASAVKAFQQREGLTVDGVVGAKSWSALLK